MKEELGQVLQKEWQAFDDDGDSILNAQQFSHFLEHYPELKEVLASFVGRSVSFEEFFNYISQQVSTEEASGELELEVDSFFVFSGITTLNPNRFCRILLLSV